MDTQKRIFAGVFAVSDRDQNALLNMPDLIARALRSRDNLIGLERCMCLAVPLCQVMPNCVTQHGVLAFRGDIERLNVPVLNELIQTSDLDTRTGGDLELILQELIPLIKAFDELYDRFGDQLLVHGAELSGADSKVKNRLSSRKRRAIEQLPDRTRSLFKIFFALAIDKFGHDPDAKKSKATSLIHDATVRAGYEVSQDTIRKLLDDALDVILTHQEKLARDD